jgi:hypothetical protein
MPRGKFEIYNLKFELKSAQMFENLNFKPSNLFSNFKLQISNSWRSQAGVGQLVVVMVLLAGLAVGTYVVQQRTNISPNADEACTDDVTYCDGGRKIHKTGGYQDENGVCVFDYQDEGSCDGGGNNNGNGESCEQEKWTDEVTSGESSCQDGKVCYKAWKRNSDCSVASDGWACTDQSCGGSNSNNSDSQCNYSETCSKDGKNGVHTCKGTKQDGVCKYDPAVNPDCTSCQVDSEESSNSQGGTSQPGNSGDQQSSSNQQYDQGDCRDGAQVYKDGYTWITYCNQVCSKNSDCSKNTTDGAVNPETSNWCYGFNGGKTPRCMKLVQSDNTEINNSSRKETNTKAVEEIKKTIASGGNPNSQSPTQSSSVDLRAKINAQVQQRGSLIGELATVLNAGGTGNSNLSAAVSRAQTLLNEAAGKSAACYTGNDKPLNDACDAVAQAANDTAVAAARVALFDAVAAGIPDTCVKVDMSVGANTSNSQIEVTPAGGSAVSRLFMCRGKETTTGAKNGDLKWRVRDDKGVLQEVSQASLTQLGLSSVGSSIPQDFINRRNNAATLSNQASFSATSTSTNVNTSGESVNNCRTDTFCRQERGTGSVCGTDSRCTIPSTSATQQSTTTQKKNLEKGATCQDNSWCKSGQCNPGTSKCI